MKHRSSPLAAPLVMLRSTVIVMAVTCVWSSMAWAAEPTGTPFEDVVHLVVDSGSSGTRMCAFRTRVTVDATAGRSCTLNDSKPICVRSPGGLASATADLTPEEAEPKVTEALSAAFASLARQVPELSSPGSKWAAAALGTGGYRNPQTGEIDPRPVWQQVWRSTQAFLKEKGAVSVVARPITGTEEAQLAWQGTRDAARSMLGAFAVLEIGGATAQLAGPMPSHSGSSLKGWSTPDGINAVFARLRAHPLMDRCFNSTNRRLQDADSCVKLVQSEGLSTWTPPESAPWRELMVLGASWSGTMNGYGESSRVSDVHTLLQLARRVCPSTDEEILRWAPREFNASRSTGMACFTLSLQAAILLRLGAEKQPLGLTFGGDDRWARGAAISGDFFEGCSAAAPSK